ncbi:MAG: FAD:protein FMN transferase [Candidatus Azobacteroides sp.]|nr:FAD:protein FMN transferase [Candidatus Azobacteroides sp.]
MQTLYKAINEKNGLLYTWFEAMHTRMDILLCGCSKKEGEHLAGLIYKEIKQLEEMADFYNKDSELYKLNTSANQHPVRLSMDLFTMIDDCIVHSKRNEGCFDITVQSHNYNKTTLSTIRLCREEHAVFYTRRGVRIDLSGYVKGYALDKVVDILKREGQENALINMGNSSVFAMGNHPYGDGWKISTTLAGNKEEGKSIVLHNNCLTTSDNHTKERKHIISPSTGNYLEGFGYISVLTDRGTTGEILSTALLVADPSQREKIKKNYEFEIGYEIK